MFSPLSQQAIERESAVTTRSQILTDRAAAGKTSTYRSRWRRLASIVAVLGVFAAVGVTVQSANAATTRYVLTAFTSSSQSNMNVYTSTDGLTFKILKANAYTPPSGAVRDPSIWRAADGTYYIVYTNSPAGKTSQSFGVAKSTNLTSWTFVTNVNVNISGTQLTWAPEFFIDADKSVNVIVSLSPNPQSADTGFRPYKLTAKNAALTSWSGATALSGDFAGTNHIDTFIVRYSGFYHAFTKNETTKYIEHATATTLGGPYKFVGTGNWSGWGPILEGPAVVHLDNGTWRIYMDGYSQKKYFYADSKNLNAWGAKVQLPGGLSGVVRHGTVLHDTV
jgi:sucrose-6-phosphate hydrolase SacC (GH32 family)